MIKVIHHGKLQHFETSMHSREVIHTKHETPINVFKRFKDVLYRFCVSWVATFNKKERKEEEDRAALTCELACIDVARKQQLHFILWNPAGLRKCFTAFFLT